MTWKRNREAYKSSYLSLTTTRHELLPPPLLNNNPTSACHSMYWNNRFQSGHYYFFLLHFFCLSLSLSRIFQRLHLILFLVGVSFFFSLLALGDVMSCVFEKELE